MKNRKTLALFGVLLLAFSVTEAAYSVTGPDAVSNNGIDDGVQTATHGGLGRSSNTGSTKVLLSSTCSSTNYRSNPQLLAGTQAFMEGTRDLDWEFQLRNSKPDGLGATDSPIYHVTFKAAKNFYNSTSPSNPEPTVVFGSGFSPDPSDKNFATPVFMGIQFAATFTLTFPNLTRTETGVDANGNKTESHNRYSFISSRLSQNGLIVGAPAYDNNASPDGSFIVVRHHVFGALPQNFQYGRYYPDNCNAIKSPLMLFFDDRRPSYQGVVNFKITTEMERTYWPEAGAPGYFLALDRNKDGRINDGYELFGNFEDANGFETLRELDSNKDGLIDEKDERFSELLLWQDKNSNGISEKSELFSIKDKKVRNISLNYNSNRFLFYAARATARQYSNFEFTDEKGKNKKGEVIDMWFYSAPNQQTAYFPTPWFPGPGLSGPSLMDVLRRPQLESRLSE
ncbi:MAG: hypothetical protein H6617_08835 [Bdellovibrionaceae bacterium]|nr:hypothetical protein [Bdellovibrionales bacterium]MCB9254772.1 hypothetical protein [Pseudobdellovibrionaceae bacterium]